MTCHDCLAELINRRTALRAMLDLALKEAERLDAAIDDVILRQVTNGKVTYKRGQNAD